MIKLVPIKDKQGHFVLSSDEPIIVEVIRQGEALIAHVYRKEGSREPVGGYDSSLPDNVVWEV